MQGQLSGLREELSEERAAQKVSAAESSALAAELREKLSHTQSRLEETALQLQKKEQV